MSEVSHKLDKLISKFSDERIFNAHTYDIDDHAGHIYMFGTDSYHNGNGEVIEEPGVDYTMANRFIRNLNILMRANKNPIVVHMKTCGGDWVEGMAIYDAIKACPNPITIINYSHARSMSSIVFQAANKRVMMPHSYFMYHDGQLGIEGTVKQVMSGIEFSKLAEEQMLDIYVNSMKEQGKHRTWSRKRIKAWLRSQMDKKEDVYLTAKEAVTYGFADEIFGENGKYDWSALTEYTDEQLAR